jgi:hypothetical protein
MDFFSVQLDFFRFSIKGDSHFFHGLSGIDPIVLFITPEFPAIAEMPEGHGRFFDGSRDSRGPVDCSINGIVNPEKSFGGAP